MPERAPRSALATGRLAVPGAVLHYEVRGCGPALLIIPTGNGDAAPSAPLADALAGRFTVISYDRRGYSRSRLAGPDRVSEPATVEAREGLDDRLAADVDDAGRLLDQLGPAPGYVFGGSSGAIVALALLERHPERVRTAVVHEPPLASVVPDAARWLSFFGSVYRTYRSRGAAAARVQFRSGMGMTADTRPPPSAQLPPAQLAELRSRLHRNQLVWLEHELRAYPAFLPDLAALAAVAGRLVLAGGSASREHFPYQPNLVLAERIGTRVVDFPGGHVGYVTHPVEFARALSLVLNRCRR